MKNLYKSLWLVLALAGFVLAQSVPNNPIQAVLYRSQTLTTPQKTQARANIDAPSTAQIALLAPLLSPAFTGTPTIPTASTGTNTTQAASTAFVQTALGTPTLGGVGYGTGTTQAFTSAGVANQVLLSNGASAPIWATNAPTANKLAQSGSTTADANADRGLGLLNFAYTTGATNFPTPVGNFFEVRRNSNSGSDAGTFQISAQNDAPNEIYFRKVTGFTTSDTWGAWRQFAFLDSPAFSGTPTIPTAALNTNTTQAASTAFVLGQASSTTPLINGTAAIGTGTTFARADHVHPTDTTRAPLASPAFTGTPTAPTAAANNNSTQLSTTAYVDAADALKANLASPALTGSPTAPTPVANNNTTTLATTAYVNAATGGVSPANGGLVYGTGTTQAVTAAGSSGQAIRSNGAAAPTWTGSSWVIQLTTAYTNATTTLSNTALTWTIAANARTGFYCLLNTSQSVTTLGLQVAVTAPTGATGTYQYRWVSAAGTAPSTAGTEAFVSTATLATALGGTVGLTATTLSRLEGVINNSTTAGSITVQGKASSAGTTTITAGSYCAYYAL